MDEYEDSDAFEINAVAATVRAYNLRFNAYKKAADAFSNLNLYRVTPTGEPKENEEEPEEEDEEDDGEEPMQVTHGDDTSEEVVEVPMLNVSEAIEALASIYWLTPQGVAATVDPTKESSALPRE